MGKIRNFWRFFLFFCIVACSNEAPPMGNALENRDSLPVMTTYGVSKLISDSGIMRYKVITEEWQVFDRTNPPRHVFPKGLCLEQFDENFRVTTYLTADTAYWFNNNLWLLKGRVLVKKEAGQTFKTEELYWGMYNHEFYSTQWGEFTETDQRRFEGSNFRCNEAMTRYTFNNPKGFTPKPNGDGVTMQQPQSRDSVDTTQTEGLIMERPNSATQNKHAIINH